ncbi:MAG: hypothetical protein HDT28_05985 [Clostridiales bacterium]|nr:hypothetical protein [Clostridiales bacterium]
MRKVNIMVSTKRRIEKETDRQGGYGTEIVRSPLAYEYDKIYTEMPSANAQNGSRVLNDNEFNITASATQSVTDNTYTAAPTAPAQNLPPRPEREHVRREREDILPSVKTLSHGETKQEQSVERESKAESSSRPAQHARGGISGKTKIMLCVYVAVAIVLAIAVIATGVSISAASSELSVISESISQNQAVISEQQSTLASLRDDDAIRGKAVESGMIQASVPAFNVSPTENVEYPEAEPHTNGFDEFCDWLSQIIG